MASGVTGSAICLGAVLRDEAVMVYKGGHLTKSGNINIDVFFLLIDAYDLWSESYVNHRFSRCKLVIS